MTRLPGPAALVAGLLVLATGAQAQEACPGSDTPHYAVEVAIESPELRIHHDLGRSELGEMSFHGPRQDVLGLTASAVEIDTEAAYAVHSLGGRHCFWVERMRVVLRVEALDVYVAREHPPGSCPYEAILDHERKHVAVARRHLAAYASRFRQALASPLVPKPRAPALVDSPEVARERTEALIEELIAPITRELEAEMAEAQSRLDTPEAYRRVHDRCGVW